MAEIPFALDPEVEGLLREVAQDPRSTLLRVERPKAIRGLFEREPVVGVATAGLTTAERHLVQTKRAEVAFALRVLVTHTLYIDPRGQYHFTPEGVVASKERIERINALRCRLGFGSSHEDIGCREGIGHFQELAHDAGAAHASVLQLCVLAQRLEPTDNSRIHAAHRLVLDGQHRSALTVLTGLLQYPTERFIRSRALSNIAYIWHVLGDLERSLGLYTSAREADESYAGTIGSQFVVAAQLGHEHDFKRAANWLDERWTSHSPDVVWLCQAHKARLGEVRAHFQHEDGSCS